MHLTYMQCIYYILSVSFVSTRMVNGSPTIITKLTPKKLNVNKKVVSRCKRISIRISTVILAKGPVEETVVDGMLLVGDYRDSKKDRLLRLLSDLG